MKCAGIKLYLVNDSTEIFAKIIPFHHTEPGHYCVPLNHDILPAETRWAANIQTWSVLHITKH